jgi:hypothetical protein
LALGRCINTGRLGLDRVVVLLVAVVVLRNNGQAVAVDLIGSDGKPLLPLKTAGVPRQNTARVLFDVVASK